MFKTVWINPSCLLALVAGLLLLGCDSSQRGNPPAAGSGTNAAGADDKPLTKIDLQLNWFPEAEHGGFYAALVHGYYREAGLDVTILPGGPNTPVVQQVARGAVPFGVANADNLLLGRAQDAPVVAVMVPIQNSPRCIMVHEKSGIKEFAQLENLTLAMTGGAPFAAYMQKKIPLTGVQIVPYPGNVTQFLLKADYAQQAYAFSEPFVARQEGGDPHLLMLSDLGFNPYTSLLFTNENYLRDQPAVAKAMVAASIRGWSKYLDDPAETNAAIHQLNPEMGLEILEFGVETLLPMVRDPVASQHGIGHMAADRWQTLTDQLIEAELIKPGEVNSSEAFTLKFLPTNETRTPEKVGTAAADPVQQN